MGCIYCSIGFPYEFELMENKVHYVGAPIRVTHNWSFSWCPIPLLKFYCYFPSLHTTTIKFNFHILLLYIPFICSQSIISKIILRQRWQSLSISDGGHYRQWRQCDRNHVGQRLRLLLPGGVPGQHVRVRRRIGDGRRSPATRRRLFYAHPRVQDFRQGEMWSAFVRGLGRYRQQWKGLHVQCESIFRLSQANV